MGHGRVIGVRSIELGVRDLQHRLISTPRSGRLKRSPLTATRSIFAAPAASITC